MNRHGIEDFTRGQQSFRRRLQVAARRVRVGTVQRRDRLAAALSNYDAATIATTHGFCQQVLTGLGVAGDAEEAPHFGVVCGVGWAPADPVGGLGWWVHGGSKGAA